MLAVSQPTLRYWEEQFDNIRPHKTEGGTRRYTQKDIDELKTVHHLLKERKLSIADARKSLKNKRGKVDSHMELLRRLQSLREELLTLKSSLEKTESIRDRQN